MAQRVERLQIMDGDEAMGRMTLFARSDIGKVLGPNDPLSRLPENVRLTIKSVADTKFGRRIELHDALRAVETIAKASGRLKDHHQHEYEFKAVTEEDLVGMSDEDVEQALAAARQVAKLLNLRD